MATAFQASAFQNNAFQIDGVVPPVVTSWGDDAPRLIRVHEYREEPKPRKVTRKAVKRAITLATGWPFDLEQTIEALPQYIPVIPRMGETDEVALQAAIQRHLMRKTEQFLADEDDEEVALLLALD